MDIIGKTFGRWTVKSYLGYEGKNKKFLCLCSCGNEKNIAYGSLTNGDSKSCGCLRKEKKYITHGMRHTRAYSCWHNMKRRCYYEKCTQYKNYGGRGITYDPKWEKFEGFWEDMGGGYRDDLSIDRKDNNGNYCKENCRWSTREEQCRNKTNNIFVTHNGETKIFKDWMIHLGLNKKTIDSRLYGMGWSYEKTLFTKIGKYDRK